MKTPIKPKCYKCNDTGWVAVRSRDAAYAFPGPVPDDAKGYSDADCWWCDSGPPPEKWQAQDAQACQHTKNTNK